MSWDLNIGIYAEEAHIPDVFMRLLDRLLLRMSVSEAKIFEDSLTPKQVIPITELTIDLSSLLNELVQSRDALYIYGSYNLASGRDASILLKCLGAKKDDGYAIRQNGPICMGLEVVDVAPINAMGQYEELSPVEVGSILFGQKHTDAEEIFLRICDLLETNATDSSIIQGVMSTDGWVTADRCAMIYHRDISGFAQDFEHIYALNYLGIAPIDLIRLDIDIRSLSQTDIDELRFFNPPPRYQYESTNDPELYSFGLFLNSIDVSTAYKISNLTKTTISDILREAVRNIPNVRFYDFNDRGFVLSTQPISKLWRVYDYIARSAPT